MILCGRPILQNRGTSPCHCGLFTWTASWRVRHTYNLSKKWSINNSSTRSVSACQMTSTMLPRRATCRTRRFGQASAFRLEGCDGPRDKSTAVVPSRGRINLSPILLIPTADNVHSLRDLGTNPRITAWATLPASPIPSQSSIRPSREATWKIWAIFWRSFLKKHLKLLIYSHCSCHYPCNMPTYYTIF